MASTCAAAGKEAAAPATYASGEPAAATVDALQLFLNELSRYPLLTATEEVELAKRYGLRPGGPMSLTGIARRLGITRERVRAVEREALKHLARERDLQALREET